MSVDAFYKPEPEVCWMCLGEGFVKVSACAHSGRRGDPPCSEQCMRVEPCLQCAFRKLGP